MTMLGSTASMENAAKANALRWFGHVLKAEDNPMKIAFNFMVKGKNAQRAHERKK